MHYTIYKVTNKINGKFYIGIHKTKDLDDNYMGSGKYLKRSIEKHGIENFEKEILFVFDNPEEMYAKEAEIVNEDFLSEENTYNLKVGGFGGFDYINSNNLNVGNLTEEGLERCREAGKKTWETFSVKRRNSSRKKIKTIHNKYPKSPFYQKTHTEKTKKVIGEKNSFNQSGKKNSQYNTMWVTNGKENKKIKKTDPIPTGFYAGRKIKTQ